MTRFIRVLTAATVLVHATVGCCAHESHWGDEACGHVVCDAGGNHDHSSKVGLNSASPLALEMGWDFSHKSGQPAPHECCHENCTWSAPEARDSVDLMLLSFAGSIQWSLNTSVVFLLTEGIDSSVLTPHFSPHLAQVRAHLIKCVLLI